MATGSRANGAGYGSGNSATAMAGSARCIRSGSGHGDAELKHKQMLRPPVQNPVERPEKHWVDSMQKTNSVL